ncbi:MAG TPA: UDP-N-acetylmuramoyl-L-alanyl-D-glutamate--2,6-diaminopimelate ligase [Bryobacteraceae bacterium]|nr:UDP-N-acetylmuramoyl-L-alanyl-D-glutamate--2,6-diaminopimelate ligase [Bryobacteraceae bacterium]
MKTVGDLLGAAAPAELAAREVAGLAYDSRKAGPGFLFFAFPGAKVDGRVFAQQAMERGALAVASELPPPDGWAGPWIQVPHGRRALALAAREYYGRIDERLKLTGITGTNGKTTTALVLDEILRTAGKTTLVVGTIEYRLAGQVLKAVNTTPESLDLMELLARLEQAGGTHATMEVSSHGLALGRVYGLHFHTAIFTNLTRDHLDFHGTMDEYFAAKRMLFEGAGAPPPPYAVLNHDDAWVRRIKPHGQAFWYGIEEGAGVRARNIESTFTGLRFNVEHEGKCFPVRSPLPGKMNVYNVLCAWCGARSYGFDHELIAEGIAACRAVPGRFEKVEAGQPFLVVVDYAHTDDALRNVIGVARGLNPKRVITMFGCGGDRDRRKRPLMGSAAAELSDFVVVTSDNPRSEKPEAIIEDALEGVSRHSTPYMVEKDRATGIRLALEEARAGDIVILAGKGHETYQILGDKTISFDDREVARNVLRELGYKQ